MCKGLQWCFHLDLVLQHSKKNFSARYNASFLPREVQIALIRQKLYYYKHQSSIVTLPAMLLGEPAKASYFSRTRDLHLP